MMAVAFMNWMMYISSMKMGIIKHIILNITNMPIRYSQQNFLSLLPMNPVRM